MLPFVRMLEYGNTVEYGFSGIFSTVPSSTGYAVPSQNRAFSTSSGTKIYTIGGDDTDSGYIANLVEYDPVLNEYKLIHSAPNTSYPSRPCYNNGYVYILYFPTTAGKPKYRRVDVSTGESVEMGTVPFDGWCTGFVVGSNTDILYTINKTTYKLQSYAISTNQWREQGTASFGTYTSDTILQTDGYIYMLGGSVFKRMDRFGGNVVDLKPALVHPPFNGFYSSLFRIDDYIYAYSYSILQRYDIMHDKWEVVSDATPVLGALTTNAIACYDPGTKSAYLFYAVVGAAAKGTTIGKIS